MQIYKAAKYIRLSYTDDKSNESDSVGNQRKLIEEFANHHPEIELVSERVDDGYSGVIFDRPAFKEMMDDIMEGKINCVIVPLYISAYLWKITKSVVILSKHRKWF